MVVQTARLIVLALVLLPARALAQQGGGQPQGGMEGMCPGMGSGGMMCCPGMGGMSGPMHWGMMIGGVLLFASVIAALVALTVYLVRRSRWRPSPPAPMAS